MPDASGAAGAAWLLCWVGGWSGCVSHQPEQQLDGENDQQVDMDRVDDQRLFSSDDQLGLLLLSLWLVGKPLHVARKVSITFQTQQN